jgi:hypothetical protein
MNTAAKSVAVRGEFRGRGLTCLTLTVHTIDVIRKVSRSGKSGGVEILIISEAIKLGGGVIGQSAEFLVTKSAEVGGNLDAATFVLLAHGCLPPCYSHYETLATFYQATERP